MARWSFHLHLWSGVVLTALLLLLAGTGIALNHKRALGLMPEATPRTGVALGEALPLAELVRRAQAAVGPEAAEAGVDRIDVRPGNGLVKVRFDDREVTEATLALDDGAVLAVGPRNDVFLEKLHSGEVFGDHGILLSDLAAAGLTLLLLTGVWLWLYPRSGT